MEHKLGRYSHRKCHNTFRDLGDVPKRYSGEEFDFFKAVVITLNNDGNLSHTNVNTQAQIYARLYILPSLSVDHVRKVSH